MIDIILNVEKQTDKVYAQNCHLDIDMFECRYRSVTIKKKSMALAYNRSTM